MTLSDKENEKVFLQFNFNIFLNICQGMIYKVSKLDHGKWTKKLHKTDIARILIDVVLHALRRLPAFMNNIPS